MPGSDGYARRRGGAACTREKAGSRTGRRRALASPGAASCGGRHRGRAARRRRPAAPARRVRRHSSSDRERAQTGQRDTAAAAEQPGHLADLQGQHGRSRAGSEPEKDATLKIYNWVAYINQAVVNDFGKKYNCKVEVTTFNTMNEAMAKLRSGQVDFDVFMRHRRRARPAGRAEDDPAAEPQLHPEHQPGLARLHQPVLRPELAVHRPVHDLHDRASPGGRTTCTENPYTMANPWAMPWQSQVQGQGRDPRRLPRGPSASG